MHALHKILVRVTTDEHELKDYANQSESAKDTIIDEAKYAGVQAIEGYGGGEVWDWHADGPGRWEDECPPEGIILGAEDPEAFLKELEDSRLKPLSQAKASLASAVEHYTEGANLPEINSNLLERTFNEEGYGQMTMLTYSISKALDMVGGDYKFDSFFYNAVEFGTKVSSPLLKDIRENPHQYALVCIDIHN